VSRVALRFAPAMFVLRPGTFTAHTSNPLQPVLDCPLTAVGGGPNLEVSPLVLDFGLDGGSAAITLKNLGSPNDPGGALQLFGDDVTWDFDAGILGPDAGGCTLGPLPTSIAPQDEALVTVTVRPPGKWRVHFLSNDTARPTVEVKVLAGP
jgi:hypothetical protein